MSGGSIIGAAPGIPAFRQKGRRFSVLLGAATGSGPLTKYSENTETNRATKVLHRKVVVFLFCFSLVYFFWFLLSHMQVLRLCFLQEVLALLLVSCAGWAKHTLEGQHSHELCYVL